MKTSIYKQRMPWLLAAFLACAGLARAGNLGDMVVPLVTDAGVVTLELKEPSWTDACTIAGQINHAPALDGAEVKPEAEAHSAGQVVVRLPRQLWEDAVNQITHILTLPVREAVASAVPAPSPFWANAKGSAEGWEIDAWASAFGSASTGMEATVLSTAYQNDDASSRYEYVSMPW